MEQYVDLPEIDNLTQDGTIWLNDVLPSFNFSEFVAQITSGKNIFEPDKILNTLLNIFANELYSAIKLLMVIVAIIMICSVLGNLKNSFGKTGFIDVGLLNVALVIGLAAELFSRSAGYAMSITEDLTNIMWAILPVMATLTAGSGFSATGVMTHPVLYFMCSVFAEIFNSLLIPLAVSYLALSLSDTLSDTIELGKFRELLKKIYNFVLGIVMTLFTGLLSISSFAGISLDSVGAKGAKFAVSNMVPFVGRSISDAMGAVASASLVLKNAVGIAGMICMLALCVIPIIKTAVIVLSVRVSAAICEPIADPKSIQALTAVGDSLSMINAAVVSTVIMLIISLSMIVGVR